MGQEFEHGMFSIVIFEIASNYFGVTITEKEEKNSYVLTKISISLGLFQIKIVLEIGRH